MIWRDTPHQMVMIAGVTFGPASWLAITFIVIVVGLWAIRWSYLNSALKGTKFNDDWQAKMEPNHDGNLQPHEPASDQLHERPLLPGDYDLLPDDYKEWF